MCTCCDGSSIVNAGVHGFNIKSHQVSISADRGGFQQSDQGPAVWQHIRTLLETSIIQHISKPYGHGIGDPAVTCSNGPTFQQVQMLPADWLAACESLATNRRYGTTAGMSCGCTNELEDSKWQALLANVHRAVEVCRCRSEDDALAWKQQVQADTCRHH